MNLQELRRWSDEVIAAVEKYGVKLKDCTPNRELEKAFLIRGLLNRLDAAEKVCEAVEVISHASEIYNPRLRDALKKWQGVE